MSVCSIRGSKISSNYVNSLKPRKPSTKYLTMMLLLGFLTLSQFASARHLQDEVAVTSTSSTHDATSTTNTEHGDGWYYYDTTNSTSNVDETEEE